MPFSKFTCLLFRVTAQSRKVSPTQRYFFLTLTTANTQIQDAVRLHNAVT